MRRGRAIALGALLTGLVVLAPAAPGRADLNEDSASSSAYASVTAGTYSSCLLLQDGTVKCWGDFQGIGQEDTQDRGDGPGEMGDSLLPVDLGTGRTAVQLAAGGGHTCALLDDDSLKCWGYNGGGGLGTGDLDARGYAAGTMGDDLDPVNLGTGRTAVEVTAGANHTCAILDNGLVKCWGYNTEGQLGLGDVAIHGDVPGEMGDGLPYVPLGTDRTAIAISAGGDVTCVILDDGSVKCWGFNNQGQLGQGTTADRGDEPNELGDALPPVALGTGRTATAISAAANNVCAVLDNGTVKCWGANNVGQLGQGDTAARGDAPGEMGDALPAVALGTGRTATAVSSSGHTCALLDDDTVKCWGQNEFGQAGRGTNTPVGDGAGEMGDSLPAVALGTGRTVTAVTTGGFHACALLDNAALKCWGYNGEGQLGYGDETGRGASAGQMGDNLPAVRLTGPSEAATCDGMAVTVDLNLGGTPTSGSDVILGTPVGDTINGLAGVDRICGGGGADTINGGTGPDRVFGQAGPDTLRGGNEGDRLDGGTEADDLFGDAHNDTLIGGTAVDDLTGGAGNDNLTGSDGGDRLLGQDGADTLNGSAGADTLDGGNQNDRLNGGTQRDTCHGRAGTDSQSGCEVRTGIP